MADVPNNPPLPLANRRWLAITRLIAATPIVTILWVTLWVHMPALGGGCSEDISFFGTAVFWLVTPPFIISLAHLLGKSADSLKKGLAWAVVAGSFWGVISLSLGLMDIFGGSAREAWEPMLVSIVPIALVASAIKTYYSTAREKGDSRVLVRRVVLFIPYLFLMGICTAALPDLYYTRREGREAAAVEALRKINAAEASYDRTSAQGFSPTLSALGAPPAGAAATASAAGLLPADLATGARSEYTFRYKHEAPDATGKIASYTVTATPTQAACTRWRRFFTDQTGTIHVTSENHDATVNDPTL